MVSQRRHRRYDATVRVRLSAQDGQEIDGRTESISQGGMYVPTVRPLPSGHEIWGTLDLPTGEVLVDGVVAYVIDGDTRVRTPPGMGIRFEKVANVHEPALLRYLDILAHRNQGSVLIVDDDVREAEKYRSILRENDYRVVLAHDVFTAIDILRYGEITLVLAEAQMKRMDGLDLTETVRKASQDIEVVLLSRGELSAHQKIRAQRLGIQIVLHHPATPESLVQAIDTASLTRKITADRDLEPWEADTAEVPEPITAEIANKRLQQLGCTTRRSAKGMIYGQLTFLYHRVHLPFDVEQAIPRVRMGTVGLDKLQIYVPRPLATLPRLPILTMSSQLELERAIARACADRERACLDVRRLLKRLGLRVRLDSNKFACVGQVIMGGERVTFSSAHPSEVTLDAIQGWSVRDAIAGEERAVSLVGVTTIAELIERLEPAVERARLEMAPDPFES